MFKTIRYHYKTKNKDELKLLSFLCHISKNVYNVALYTLRDMYFKNENICSYYELNKMVLSNINSHIINTYQTLCIDRYAYNAMSNFIRYKKYNDNTKLPRYLDKYSYYPLITDQIRILERNNKKCIKLPLSNIVRTKRILTYTYNDDSLLSKFIEELKGININNIYFNIPKEIYNNKIHEIRIIPNRLGNYFTIEFTYSYDNDVITNGNNVMGIDIGVTNLASCAISNGNTFIIDGKYLKSINVLYNKKISKLRSLLPIGIHNSKMLDRVYRKRNNKIEDYINKSVSEIIREAKFNKVSKIVIGWNKGLKTNGIKNDKLTKKEKKVINQQFVGLPLSRFKNKLVNKAKENNIEAIIINESYTSKASFIDNDKIEKQESYSGIRIKRGLYQTKNKTLINADINASFNIIRKCNSNELNIQMSRGLTSPCRIYVSL